MRKFKIALIAAFAALVLISASSARAIVVDPAGARLCQGLPSAPTGDKFEPNTSPHCVCAKTGQGDQERVNLQVPGTAALVRAVAKYGDFRDRCATVSEIKKGPKPESKKEKSAETPKAVIPVKFMASLEPGDLANKQLPGAKVAEHLNVLTGASQIVQIRWSCDNCLANGKAYNIDNMVRAPKGTFDYPVDMVPADPIAGGRGQLALHVFDKANIDHPYTATVEWEPKAPPPPPTSPEELICKGSGGTWIAETHTCVCLNDFVLRNGVCVTKPLPPPPPPVKVVDKGTDIHPLVETLCGYGWSSSFRSGNCYVGPGLWLNIAPYFDFYGMVGVGTPGATRVYTDGSPVLKSDGTPDNRHLSLVIQSGFMAHLAWLGANVGVVRQNRGLINSVTSPTQEATSVSIGAKVLLPYDGGMFMLGPDLLVGRSQLGALDPDTEVGFTLRATWVPWNPRRRW